MTSRFRRLADHVAINDIKDRVTTWALGASSLVLAFVPIFFLFWLMQPKVLANPGMGALHVTRPTSYEPFLQDAEPLQSEELPLRESAARLMQHDPEYRNAARSAQRDPKRGWPRSAQVHKNIKRSQGFGEKFGGHRRSNTQKQVKSYKSSRHARHEIAR
jgi:hypothetical protein